ncbi:MAG: radical SAM protein [Clostridiales bacterium]|jgi:oxygen-independent coproporphyrinogen-3 oxidase|nr:radical SAM protein [Clostridiales bacterium]
MGFLTDFARIWLTRSLKPFRFTNVYDDFLPYQDTEKLGLYVHIPFCESICGFCPYCKTLYNKDAADRYIDALLQEIDIVGSMNQGKKDVTSLYFGGGSPALVADNIQRIISRLRKYFIIEEGIGLELHPQDVTEKTLSVLKQAGVTKISIGIQSFQRESLDVLGRKNVDFEGMFRALSAAAFETVSMDFIFALPGQTIDILKADIEMAFNNGANHIAVYPFIDFTFTKRRFPKMPEGQKKSLLYQLVKYCEEQGYIRDSIWTFSKDGISKYSSMTRENFLGFGCSATTLLKDQFKTNTFDVQRYIERIEKRKLPTALTLKFTVRQRMVYYLFWTAYTMRVNSGGFNSFFDLSLENCYGLELWAARLFGWIRKQDDDYIMTMRGSYYYHYFEHFYTLSYIDRMWRLMRNEAFPKSLTIR